MTTDGQLVQVQPTELRFRFELKRQIPASVQLRNASETRVAFKVKTTAPKKFCVRPSSGILGARDMLDVQIVMQAQKQMPDDEDFRNCKDKFLVQAVAVAPDVQAITPDLFDKTKVEVQETKMRVVLEAPASPPSPVPEEPGPDGDLDAAMDGHGQADDMAAVLQERSKLKRLLEEREQQLLDLKRQMQTQVRNFGSTGAQSGGVATANVNDVKLWHLLVASIVAFLLGLLF